MVDELTKFSVCLLFVCFLIVINNSWKFFCIKNTGKEREREVGREIERKGATKTKVLKLDVNQPKKYPMEKYWET